MPTTIRLTATGRTTGMAREVPLYAFEDGDRLVIVGSVGGAAKDPAWVGNLRAEPRAAVTVNRKTRQMRASEVGARGSGSAVGTRVLRVPAVCHLPTSHQTHDPPLRPRLRLRQANSADEMVRGENAQRGTYPVSVRAARARRLLELVEKADLSASSQVVPRRLLSDVPDLRGRRAESSAGVRVRPT